MTAPVTPDPLSDVGLAKYRKGIIAALGAVVVVLAALPTGDGWAWVQSVAAVLTALLVYFVPNRTQ